MKKIHYVIILLPALLFVGCNSGEIAVYPATGEVIYDGKPVENALISFVSQSSDGRGASAQTERDGTFIITTQGATKNGAVSGKYKVLVSKWIAVDDSGKEIPPAPPKEYTPDAPPEEQPIMKNILPPKYEKKESTDLTVTVEKKKNHFKLELKK
jgi:hypothetical protein